MAIKFLTVDEVGEILRVSRWSVARYIAAGELTAVKADGRNGAVRVPVESVQQYIETHTVNAEETQ